MATSLSAQVAISGCDLCKTDSTRTNLCEVCKKSMCIDCFQTHEHDQAKKIYKIEFKASLNTTTGTIYSICVTKNQHVWLYTFDRLNKLTTDWKVVLSIGIPGQFTKMSKYARSIDAIGDKVLISATDKILSVNDDSSFETFCDFESQGVRVYGIHVTEDHTVWVCLQGGRYVLALLSTTGVPLLYHSQVDQCEQYPIRVHQISTETVWVLYTEHFVLYELKSSSLRIKKVFKQNVDHGIDIGSDQYGNFLVALEDKCKMRVMSQNGKIITSFLFQGPKKVGSEIKSIYRDHSNNIWAGFGSGEVIAFELKKN